MALSFEGHEQLRSASRLRWQPCCFVLAVAAILTPIAALWVFATLVHAFAPFPRIISAAMAVLAVIIFIRSYKPVLNLYERIALRRIKAAVFSQFLLTQPSPRG